MSVRTTCSLTSLRPLSDSVRPSVPREIGTPTLPISIPVGLRAEVSTTQITQLWQASAYSCQRSSLTPYTGIHAQVYRQVHRYTGIQVHRYTGTQVYRYTGIQIYRYTDIQVYRYTGIQIYRYTDIQVYRYTGIQVYRYTGIQAGMQV